MSALALLLRLDGVKRTRPGSWLARCPAHGDQHPSLAVRELDDGRVLMHCFAGCATADVLGAIDIDFSELFPRCEDSVRSPKAHKPFSSSDILAAVAYEVLVAWNFARQMSVREILGDADRERLLTCACRLQRALEIARG